MVYINVLACLYKIHEMYVHTCMHLSPTYHVNTHTQCRAWYSIDHMTQVPAREMCKNCVEESTHEC